MPHNFLSPAKAYSPESKDGRSSSNSCEEIKMSVVSPSSPSCSSAVSSCDISSDSISYIGLPSPNQSPSKSSSSSSPSFRERLRTASRLLKKNLQERRPSLRETMENEELEKEKLHVKVKDSDGFKSYFREHFILSELKLLSRNHQGGVYVMPSLNNLQVWYGVIFLRAGPYRDGIFRFFIFFPDDFPDSRPLVKFTTPVFHPQVHQNGVLNLDVAFPKWQKQNHSIWQIIKYMKNCFYCADTWGATNQDAKNIIHTSIDDFKKKVQSCVLYSQRLYDFETFSEYCDDDGNFLRVKRMSAKDFEEGRKLMSQGILFQSRGGPSK